jgi:type IV pilus assembly protein PilB
MNPPTHAAAAPTKPKRGNGITTPSRRGGSGRVLTDVIVDLGFVDR